MFPALIARLRAHRRFRRSVVELSALTSDQLNDIGIRRSDIERLSRLKSGIDAHAGLLDVAAGRAALAR